MKISDLFEAFDRHDLHDLKNPNAGEVTAINSDKRLAKIIKTQCSDMLQAYKMSKGLLYRGLADTYGNVVSSKKESTTNVIITGIRQDRRPVQMKPKSHELLKSAFDELGLKVNRSNSIFTSPDRSTAFTWGDGPFVVFVKNGWTGLVFNKTKHTYAFYELSSRADKVSKYKNIENKILTLADGVKELEPVELTSPQDLAKVIKEKYSEVMLTGDSYIAINANYFNKNIAPLLGLGLE